MYRAAPFKYDAFGFKFLVAGYLDKGSVQP